MSGNRSNQQKSNIPTVILKNKNVEKLAESEGKLIEKLLKLELDEEKRMTPRKKRGTCEVPFLNLIRLLQRTHFK
jgi:hypothetical protein